MKLPRFQIPQGLTALGLLYRLLVLLRRLVQAQERLAEATELQLKLSLLQDPRGATVQDLKEFSLEGGGTLELIQVSPEEQALRRDLTERAEASGWKLDPADDVVDVFKKEGFIQNPSGDEM